MKFFTVIVVWFISISILAAQNDFSKVDEFARRYKTKTTDVSKLTNDLTSIYNNDLDKVRSIFIWITNNIQYDYKEYKRILKGKKESYKIVAGSEKELAEKQRKLEESRHNDAIRNTLSKRKGVCQDYTELFTEMCKNAHIKSGVIEGSIKDIAGNFIYNNHTWNWVEIKGKTYLLDATWAAGYLDDAKGKYYREFNEGFFLTPPAMFLVNHFPNDSRWQLVNDKISVETFKEYPAVGQGFFLFKVKSFSPKTSKVSMKGSKLSLDFKFGEKPKVLSVSNNGQLIKDYKVTDDDFSASLDIKKGKNIDVWGDRQLIISYIAK